MTIRATHAAIVTLPSSGQKVRALRNTINLRRMQLDSMRADAIDAGIIRQDLDALEAILLDYQPENRVGRSARG